MTSTYRPYRNQSVDQPESFAVVIGGRAVERVAAHVRHSAMAVFEASLQTTSGVLHTGERLARASNRTGQRLSVEIPHGTTASVASMLLAEGEAWVSCSGAASARVVGVDGMVAIFDASSEMARVDVAHRDRVVLCASPALDWIEPRELARVIRNAAISEVASALVALASRHGASLSRRDLTVAECLGDVLVLADPPPVRFEEQPLAPDVDGMLAHTFVPLPDPTDDPQFVAVGPETDTVPYAPPRVSDPPANAREVTPMPQERHKLSYDEGEPDEFATNV